MPGLFDKLDKQMKKNEGGILAALEKRDREALQAITPKSVSKLLQTTPETVKEQPKKVEPPKLTPALKKVYAEELAADKEPTVKMTVGKGKKVKVKPQGKIAPKNLERPDNPFAPLFVNALNTASLGLLERNTDAIDQLREKAPIRSTIGSALGYLVPFSATKNALVKGTQSVGKRILTDASIGAGIDTATELVKGKNDFETAAKNVAMGAGAGILADVGLTALGKIGKLVAENIKAGKLAKIPAETVTKSTAIKSAGRYKVKNTALDKAINEYNAAVETIQNHFRTNQLRADEMARIKTDLGIDLDKLVKNIEDAEKGISVSEIGKQQRLARAAGVKSLPNIKPTIEPKPQVNIKPPQIENKSLKTALNEVKISPELAEDPVYKELSEELKGVKVDTDETIKAIAPQIKDKSGLTLNLKDFYRNMRDIFGKSYDYVKKKYVDPFDASKKAYTDEVKKYTDEIYTKVVKSLGINKGTKESAAVQNYGEGLVTKEQLIKEFGEKKANDIIEADKIFRKVYDELIEKVNATRAKIYPNNPEKLVPKRKDYYRHFTEMAEGFKGLKNIFETPSAIDPKLAGMSEFTQPKSRWASFMQKRGDGEYTADAVGGFLNYIQPAAYSIHIDPHISKFRALAKDIAEATQNTRNANNTIKYLNDFANSLAGKTSKYDRVLQEDIPGGRTAFKAINWLNSRVKANQVLMNAQSTISQLANVPVGVARIKDPVAIAKGIGQTMAGIVGKGNKAIAESQFINERYINDLLSRFDKKLTQQPKKFAAWLLEGADKLGTTFTWNSAYNKAVAQGIDNPVKYADDLTRSIVAGRGIGETPLLQQSKTFQLIAPFQLEVANLWHVLGDTVKEKDVAGIALILLGNYLFNNVTENLTGNRITLDPVDAMLDALAEEDTNAGNVVGRITGEVLSNVPLGQTIAAMYPEYGADISTPMGSISLPSRKEFFGDTDPTRFGGGLLVTKALTDPLYKVVTPFGGSQLKKTIEGIKAVNEGMVAKNGKMYFPVEQSTENYIRSALFGKYATDEAREYFEKDRRPLTEKQTAEILKQKDIKSAYEKLMNERRINTLQNKIKAVKVDKTLTEEEKKKKISDLQKEIGNIRKLL